MHNSSLKGRVSQSTSAQLPLISELRLPARASFTYAVRLSQQLVAVIHLLICVLSVRVKQNSYPCVRHRAPFPFCFRFFHPVHIVLRNNRALPQRYTFPECK